MLNKYYVYGHYRPKCDKPFYIGMGCGDRAGETNPRRRNVVWNRIYKKYGRQVILFEKEMTQDEAFEMEIALIKGFQEEGMCEANLGEGGLGGDRFANMSEERLEIAKAKMRNGHIGRKPTVHGNVSRDKLRKKALHRMANPEVIKQMRIRQSHGVYHTPYGEFYSYNHIAETGKVSRAYAIKYIKDENNKEWYFVPKE